MRFAFGCLFVGCMVASASAEPRDVPGRDVATPHIQTNSPPNDDFATAETIVSNVYLIPGTLDYATRQVNERKIRSTSLGRTVWYKYVATETGRAVAFVTKRATEAPFQLAVYSGTTLTDLKLLGSKQVVGSASDYSGTVGFDTVAGAAYYFQVDTGPRPDQFVGSFLIGVQPVGSTGNIAAFAAQQMVFQEGYFDTQRTAFVANGNATAVRFAYRLTNMEGNMVSYTSKTYLRMGEAATVNFNDGSKDFDYGSLHQGTLELTSKSAINGLVLGTYSLPISLLTTDRDYTKPSEIEVRFVDPQPGTQFAGTAKSTVYVRNKSTYRALGCRFDLPNASSDNAVSSLAYTEILANGSRGPVNGVFNMYPGTFRRFDLSMRVAENYYYHNASLVCASDYASISSNDSSHLAPWAYFGLYGNVAIRPIADNVFGEVKVGDFGTRRVYTQISNLGRYSGYFSIEAADDTSEDRAVLDSMCLVNDKGWCVGPASKTRIDFDMAEGETRRIRLDVRRGNSGYSGEIRLWAHATDYSSYDTVGYGAITVKKKW